MSNNTKANCKTFIYFLILNLKSSSFIYFSSDTLQLCWDIVFVIYFPDPFFSESGLQLNRLWISNCLTMSTGTNDNKHRYWWQWAQVLMTMSTGTDESCSRNAPCALQLDYIFIVDIETKYSITFCSTKPQH